MVGSQRMAEDAEQGMYAVGPGRWRVWSGQVAQRRTAGGAGGAKGTMQILCVIDRT